MASGTHQAFERFSRGAAGLAGASADPFRVTLEDWSIVGPDAASVRVQAHQENWAIDLTLEAAKPLTLHGDRGLSQKSPEPGNASFYYSFTRMATQGRMTTPAGSFDVGGESWMDHEWSTSVLSQDTRGWDWFALQLNDGSELMYYRLWQADGSDNPATSGTWVSFGEYGLKCTTRGMLTARQIEAARRAINRYIKRGGKVWIRIFPDKPVTKKPLEVRMGSGKGNVELWVAKVKPGRVLYEVEGVTEVVAREAFRLAAAKLPVQTIFVTRTVM